MRRHPLIILALLGSCTVSEGELNEDAGYFDSGQLEDDEPFWESVAICGTPVEQYASITDMADSADVVVVGLITDVARGNTVQGDASEDFYAEANLQISVTEVLRHTASDVLRVSLILPRVFTPEDLEPAMASLRASLPSGEVIFLLRERTDFDDLYRLVNDAALWTPTRRAPLDNPIAHSQCDGHFGEPLQDFLEGAQTLDELVHLLRD